LPCPALRAGQGKNETNTLLSGQSRAKQGRAQGRAGHKKVLHDGLWY